MTQSILRWCNVNKQNVLGLRYNQICQKKIFLNLVLPTTFTLFLGTPAEISSAVCYLNSPAAAYITGTTLNVDGGSSLYSPPLVPVEGIFFISYLFFIVLNSLIYSLSTNQSKHATFVSRIPDGFFEYKEFSKREELLSDKISNGKVENTKNEMQ